MIVKNVPRGIKIESTQPEPDPSWRGRFRRLFRIVVNRVEIAETNVGDNHPQEIASIRNGTLELLNALGSGPDGCVILVESRSGSAAISRIETSAQVEGTDPASIRRLIAEGVHLVACMTRNSQNEQVVGSVSRVAGTDGDAVFLETLWELRDSDRWATPVGGDPDGWAGELYVSAGVRIGANTD